MHPYTQENVDKEIGGLCLDHGEINMTDHLPKYLRSRAGGFKTLSSIAAIQAYQPYFEKEQPQDTPKRKSLEATPDRGLFIKPVKQCFVRNHRLMPMTRLMLTLLSGWAGQGGPIKTTIGIIAKHIGRSSRMVFNYLKDATEEGYLFYSRTKDRIGRYTGICVRLNFPAIRYYPKATKMPKGALSLAMKYPTETNHKYILKTKKDDLLNEKLKQFARTLGNSEKLPCLE